MSQIFLDANAHLPMNQAGLKAFLDFQKTIGAHGHPSSPSVVGREASIAFERSRAKIAELIGAQSSKQIIFTNSSSEACEWALNILKSKYDKAYMSPMEHPSIKYHFRKLFGQSELNATKSGMTACEFNTEDKAVVCIHVQNEIGTIQPIEKIQAPLMSDMTQSLGKVQVDVSSMPNLKLATFGSHKFGGPSSFGFMYIKDEFWWYPMGSGSRYVRDRQGTPDVGNAVATAAALEFAIKTLPARYDRMIRFRNIVENELNDLGLKIIGMGENRCPNTTFFKIGNRMGPYLVGALGSEGIHVGLGSACGSVVTGSHPLMGRLGHGGSAQDYIRLSNFGEYSEREAHFVAKALKKYCPKKDPTP
jgi:cysteine desulfurase